MEIFVSEEEMEAALVAFEEEHGREPSDEEVDTIVSKLMGDAIRRMQNGPMAQARRAAIRPATERMEREQQKQQKQRKQKGA